MLECGRRLDRPESVAPIAKNLMADAGFVDIVEEQFKWPTNPWPEDAHLKELGMWTDLNQKLGFEASSLAFFTRVLGWSVEELNGFLKDLQGCAEDPSIHAYWPM
jgi:hypothetical protein